MITLEDALAGGRGIERPFNCPAHADFHASASVNVVLNVWYCYACAARGRVDGKRVPSDTELMAMLKPEQAARIYPDSWLGLFTVDDGYWQKRFPAWLCTTMGLGEDPITGEATFPVRTPEGKLAGVGRRSELGNPKYRYPANWSASRTLGGIGGPTPPYGVVMLVEGYADYVAGWQVGCPTFACWGAGVHLPQRELVARLAPRLILFGFDADDAGHAAGDRAQETLGDLAPTAYVHWDQAGGKDPAETDVEARRDLLIETVTRSGYGRQTDVAATMADVANALHAGATRKE